MLLLNGCFYLVIVYIKSSMFCVESTVCSEAEKCKIRHDGSGSLVLVDMESVDSLQLH